MDGLLLTANGGKFSGAFALTYDDHLTLTTKVALSSLRRGHRPSLLVSNEERTFYLVSNKERTFYSCLKQRKKRGH